MSLALPDLAPEPTPRAFGDGRLRVLHVGGGFVAPHHLAGWRGAGAEVVGLVAHERTRAEERAAEFDVPAAFDDLAAALDATRADVVDLAAPPALRLAHMRTAADRGVHVLCQKPLALDWRTSRAVAAAARAGAGRVMVHENFRFRVWYREVKRLLDHGEVGRPVYARLDARLAGAVASAAHPETPYSLARQPFFATMTPLIVLESMVHQIDVARFLFGEPVAVYARTRRVSPHVRGEDLAIVVLSFPALDVVLERSYAARGWPDPPLPSEWGVVEGAEGAIHLDRDGALRVVRDLPGERRVWTPPLDRRDAYARSYADCVAHFVEALRTGAPFETGLEDNLRTLRATFAALASAETGEAVRLHDRSPP